MKLKTILLTLSAVSVLSSLAQASDAAEVLYDAKCASCHVKTKPNNPSILVAPAIMGVMRHVKMKYPAKEDAVKFISDYVLNPQKEKAVCMPQKLKRFGLMPSQKGNITEVELSSIANWLYDNFPPANFRGNQSQNMNDAKKSSPFLINTALPHMVKMVKQHWDDPVLNLSEVQKKKLLVVRKETMQNVQRLVPQVKALENKIIMMTMHGKNPQKLSPMVKQLSQLKAEATQVHIGCIYDTKNILTPEQVHFLLK